MADDEPRPRAGRRTFRGTLVAVLVSAAALAALVLHVAVPRVPIDGITVGLLVVAVVPWLGDLIESIELPGGVKFELRRLNRRMDAAQRSAAGAGREARMALLAANNAPDVPPPARSVFPPDLWNAAPAPAPDARPQRVERGPVPPRVPQQGAPSPPPAPGTPAGPYGSPGPATPAAPGSPVPPAPAAGADDPYGSLVRQLCAEYGRLRTTMRAGRARTARMDKVFAGLLNAVPRAPGFDTATGLASPEPGDRLAAYAGLYASPDAALLDRLADAALTEPLPYSQYWAFNALGHVLGAMDPGDVPYGVVRRLGTALDRMPLDSDRVGALERALAAAGA